LKLKRHIIIALCSNALPFLISLIVLPYTIKFFGVSVLGFLNIYMVFVGFATILDLGISKSLTIAASKLLIEDNLVKLNKMFWTSLLFLSSMIFLISLFVYLIILLMPTIADFQYGKIIKDNFIYITGTVVFVIGSSLFTGVLSSYKQFNQINTIKAIFNIFIISSPIISYQLNFGVSGIIIIIFLFRMLNFFILCIQYFLLDNTFRRIKFDLNSLRDIIKEGSWIAMSNLISPVIVNLDRIALAKYLGVDSVAYYGTSLDTFSKINVLSSTITTVAFPTFTEKNLCSDDKGLRFFIKILISIFIVISPIVFVIILYARPIISVWIDKEFSDTSFLLSQILLLGVFWNALAQLPMSYMQAIGKSKITGLIHLFEIIFFIPLTIVLISNFGIIAAAIAWSFRVFVDFIILMYFSCKSFEFNSELSNLLLIIGGFFIFNILALLFVSNLESFLFFLFIIYLILFIKFSFKKYRLIYEKC
jgi:O-antigen/teichoic acid export membrane protein